MLNIKLITRLIKLLCIGLIILLVMNSCENNPMADTETFRTMSTEAPPSMLPWRM